MGCGRYCSPPSTGHPNDVAAMKDHLNACWVHGDQPCDCPAYLVAMGCMDLLMEQWIESCPGFGAQLLQRLRPNEPRSNIDS